jgi:hypothetical protein
MFLNECGGMWEIMVMTYFMAYPTIFLEKLRKPENILRITGLWTKN